MTRAAIVLAAGQGRRFGSNKMLSDFHGKPLITQAIAAACAAPVEIVFAVVGTDAASVSAIIQRQAPREVTIVMAHDHAEGMSASLRAGIDALPLGTEAVAIFLGDMPKVPHDLAARLFAAVEAAPASAPVYEGRRGHPAVFTGLLFPRLLALKGDAGARDIFNALGDRWARVPCSDEGIFFDIDWPEQDEGS